MLKKLAALVMAALMLFSFAPAMADYGTLYMVVDCVSAPMYAGYSDNSAILRYINAGEIVYCFAALDDCLCVIYGNHLGYIDEKYLASVDDRYYEFFLPNGEDQQYLGGNQYVEYRGTPYFGYVAQEAKANQKLATRSGPGTDYTGTLTYPQSTKITVYYETQSPGANWVMIGFTYKGEDYLLYTGAKRVDTTGAVPFTDAEEGFPVQITQDLTPYYGPGYNYAYAEHSVPAGSSVTGIYHAQDGWVMFDYQVPGGRIQRAWAPKDYWK